jgi:hypothetical protein
MSFIGDNSLQMMALDIKVLKVCSELFNVFVNLFFAFD